MATGSVLPRRCAVCVTRAASNAGLGDARDTRTASPFAQRGQVFPRRLRRAESFRELGTEFYRNRVVKQCTEVRLSCQMSILCEFRRSANVAKFLINTCPARTLLFCNAQPSC